MGCQACRDEDGFGSGAKSGVFEGGQVEGSGGQTEVGPDEDDLIDGATFEEGKGSGGKGQGLGEGGQANGGG